MTELEHLVVGTHVKDDTKNMVLHCHIDQNLFSNYIVRSHVRAHMAHIIEPSRSSNMSTMTSNHLPSKTSTKKTKKLEKEKG